MLKGLIFSGQLLLDLVEKGVPREEAYRWVQRNAMQVWETREDFRTLVERDVDIRQYLTPREIGRAFSVERQLGHVDEIFRRVFRRSQPPASNPTLIFRSGNPRKAAARERSRVREVHPGLRRAGVCGITQESDAALVPALQSSPPLSERHFRCHLLLLGSSAQLPTQVIP